MNCLIIKQLLIYKKRNHNKKINYKILASEIIHHQSTIFYLTTTTAVTKAKITTLAAKILCMYIIQSFVGLYA